MNIIVNPCFERREQTLKKIHLSFGYGSEYKYDWGNFENRGSYNASTKGHMKNFGIFGNLGYKLMKNKHYHFMEDRMIITQLVEMKLIKLILQNFLTIWNLH